MEKFRIFDYNSLGYPQVGIWYTDMSEPVVTELSDSEIDESPMDVDDSCKTNIIADFLEKQLKASTLTLVF